MNEQGQIVYRALSKTAIVAMIFAVVGILSLFVPQLVVIPVFAIGIALLALWRIRNADGDVAGVGLVVFTLFVSFFCVSNVVAHYSVHTRRLVKETRGHAEAFFDLLAQKEMYKAHQLMLPEPERRRQGADLSTYYQATNSNESIGDESPNEMLESAFEAPAMKQLVEFLQQGKRPKFVRPLGTTYETAGQLVRLEYQLEKPDDLFMIVFRRYVYQETGETTWQFWRTAKKGEV